MRNRIRKLTHRLRMWNRRRKLKNAYGTIAKIETGKRVGFTPAMRTYRLLERDGWAEYDEGELYWRDDRVQ